MTDQEFNDLKIKIQIAESYVTELQRQYQGQTGTRFFPHGRLTFREKDVAIEMISKDFSEITCGVHYA